jgi:N-acetylglucosamine kinase-like BadF-type ATPase
MMKYFLGVDVGATKSHALIADEQGNALGVGHAGPGNHENVGFDGFRAVLFTAVDQACQSVGITRDQISGAGLGVGGFDWPSDVKPHQEVIDSLHMNAPYKIVNDAVIGLIAGATEGWGLSVVAGTGNNCRGRDQYGREGRTAGESYWTAEYGGGTDLTVKAVQAVWLAWTKRGPETRLTDKILEFLGASDPLDMLEGLCRHRYRLGAAQAGLVFETAAEGDPVAQDVIRWMGRELGSLAIGVIRQLAFESLEFEVVLTGSLYKGSPLMVEPMREVIHAVAPGAHLVYLNCPPVVGAVLLGMQVAGLNFRATRPTLIDTAKQALGWKDAAFTAE